MTVLVDSDILIEVSGGRNSDVVSTWIELSNSDAAVPYSPLSVAELWAGGRPNEFDALGNLFRALTCTPIDEEVGRQADLYVQRYRRSHGVEVADALIAANAVASRAQLWTRNRKHYPMKGVSFFRGDFGLARGGRLVDVDPGGPLPGILWNRTRNGNDPGCS